MPPLIQPGEETEISTNVENPVEKPEQEFQPGDLAPVWSGPIACASVSHEAENALIECCRSVGNKDVAARRWEVEQEWEMRLYQRGNQNLLPRRGGGWVVPPYSTIYNQQRGRHIFGEETNILAAYGAIITAALGRDIPHVRFEPQNPMDDADVTAADAATRYARLFSHSNDLLTFQDQLVYYLFTGGRAIICTDFILNAQQYGRDTIPAPDPIVPENEDVPTPSVFLLMRHGETALNREDRARGRSESPLDEMGNAQVEQAANFLKGRSISAIISSPVERARESAQMIAQALKLPLTLDDRLASFDLGSLQGQAISDMREMFERAKANPDELMGGTGESWNDFVARIGEVLESLLTVAPGAPPPLVITHDSVIRQMAEMLNGSGGWIPGMTPPGGVAQCCALPDSTYSIHPIFPSTPPLPPSHRTRPRGREVVSCYGKLEAHVPINCAGLDEMPFVQLCREYDVDIVKAMFPEKADKIHPGGGGGGGENELDRIARINVNLALDASYVTGDSMVRDVTVRRTFLRPAAFMRTKPEIRAELFETFPEGCQVIMAGDIFIQARACSMDDHLTLVQAFPGSGQNRLGLGSTMLTAQKRVNNWMNLQDAYFERTVPNRYVDAKLLDAAALNSQSNMPGDYVPVLDPDGAPVNPATAIFVEPTPQPQPTMAQFIQLFMEQVPQLLSGATPTLFGALSNTDTPVGTAAIQRDQALARLTLTWHALTEATSRYFLQAVQLAARCRTSDICGAVGAETIRIELSELKGKCQARPEESANFPESWNQRQFRLTQLLQDANNPLIAPILEHPQNMRLAKDALGVSDFAMPEGDAYQKQLGEFEMLRRSGPLPNPAAQQAMQQVQQLLMQAQQNPQLMQIAQQTAEQAKAIPPEISSVAIDPIFDLHSAEYQACADFINSPEGRAMKNGTQKERMGFANIRLHALEHKAHIQPSKSGDIKPPHISVNYRDLPPAAAAEALQQAGVGVPPAAVKDERASSTELKRLGKTPLNPEGA